MNLAIYKWTGSWDEHRFHRVSEIEIYDSNMCSFENLIKNDSV